MSELIALNLQDYSETERWLKIVGKGKKERLVPVTAQLVEGIRDYLTQSRILCLKKNGFFANK